MKKLCSIVMIAVATRIIFGVIVMIAVAIGMMNVVVMELSVVKTNQYSAENL